MFSTLTQNGAKATLDALAKGATDYVTKPSTATGLDQGVERIKNELTQKIKALCSEAAGLEIPDNLPKPKPVITQPEDLKRKQDLKAINRVDVVAIGVSTGGPNALAELLPAFPANFPAPIVIVQHMPPFFTQLLADRLNSETEVTVQECKSGTVLQPGNVYLAPGDHHMVVEQNKDDVVAILNQEPQENFCRPSADVLFRSIAKVFGRNALAVVLTGMGHDGTDGCRHIQDRGGQVIVQDEATSVVWGMPGFVVKGNLADSILPLGEIAEDIIKKSKTGRPLAFSASQ
jgi:two-component system chemotaxis response regulator CheB